MATVESPQEMMDRVKGMAEGDPTWDLSDNDRLALAALIRRVERYEALLKDLEIHPGINNRVVARIHTALKEEP